MRPGGDTYRTLVRDVHDARCFEARARVDHVAGDGKNSASA